MLNQSSDNTQSDNEIEKYYNIFEIFQLNSQKKPLLILTFIWFTVGFCFYGLFLNLEHLGGDMMTDSIFTFSAEIASDIISGYLADKYGRLIVLQGSQFFGGLGFIFYVFFDDIKIKAFLVFITSFGFGASFNLIFIYTPEIFPTSIRSTVMGYLYLISRIGALAAPSLTIIIPKPPIFLGILSLISSYFCTHLTETLGKEIEDDIPEIKTKKEFLFPDADSQRKFSSLSRLSTNQSIVSEHYSKF